MAYRAGKLNDHLRDDRRSNEPGGANGVTITAAVKARNCQRALPASSVTLLKRFSDSRL